MIGVFHPGTSLVHRTPALVMTGRSDPGPEAQDRELS